MILEQYYTLSQKCFTCDLGTKSSPIFRLSWMEDYVLRCTTHFRRLKCDLKIDNSASAVTISGVGHQIWRENFFPVVAKVLFAQFVKLADSQVYESFDNECTDERKNADECTTDPTREEHFAGMQPLSQAPLTASRIAYDLLVYTSIPIVNRLETQQDRINMQLAYEIKRLDRMESDLMMFKQSVISNIEQQIQDLKSSVFDMIAKMKPDQTYAAAVQTSSQSSDGLTFQQE